MTRRTIAIGDIHGCAFALDAILDAVEPGPDDLIVCLGDVIDFGRESCDVVARLMDLEWQTELVVIQGNHEEMLLGALGNERLRNTWFNLGGAATISSYRCGGTLRDIPAEHIEFLRRCRDFFETDTHLFVHANYDPDLPLRETPARTLRWTLLDDPHLRPHQSGKTVIAGHTEQRDGEVLDLGRVKCIDTYCHGYAWLTALDVHSGQVWQASRWGVLREAETVDGLQRARAVLHQHVAL
jgi:Calcineurin-like phosphoesterase